MPSSTFSQTRFLVSDENAESLETEIDQQTVRHWFNARSEEWMQRAFTGIDLAATETANTATRATARREVNLRELYEQIPVVDRDLERERLHLGLMRPRMRDYRNSDPSFTTYWRDLDRVSLWDEAALTHPKPPTTTKISIECPLERMPGKAEPDWSRFEYLELLGCRIDEGQTEVVTGLDKDEAKFFSVYGSLKGGGVEPILEISGVPDGLNPYATACHRASQLAKMSFLPLYILV